MDSSLRAQLVGKTLQGSKIKLQKTCTDFPQAQKQDLCFNPDLN